MQETIKQTEYPSFDELEQVEVPDFDEETEIEHWPDMGPGDEVTGELVGITEKAGQYENRLYKLRTDAGLTGVWGAGNLDRNFDNSELEVGDVIGIRKTDETFETENGTGFKYELARLA